MKTPKVLKGRPGRSAGGDIVNTVVLVLVGAFMFLPMLFVINNAFKPLDELFVYPPRLFVRNPTFPCWVPFLWIRGFLFLDIYLTRYLLLSPRH